MKELEETQSREKRKRKRNEEKKRLDTSPVELKVGMEVLLQGVNNKLWNIEGVVKEVHPGSQSAFIYVPAKEKTYLRNRRFIKVNKSLEYDQANFDSCLALNVQQKGKQAKKSILNQSKTPMRKEKLVSFNRLALMGEHSLMAKLGDRKDHDFTTSIKSL